MKQRLDTTVFERGLTESREKAKSLIMAGMVFVNGQKVDKAGFSVTSDDKIELKGNDCPYVSRGGLKLEKALHEFHIDVNNMIAIDIGASSGGFTDCLLENGASDVYAIDVGYGQIAYKLRINPKVHLYERTNFRYMNPDQIPKADIAVMDVSFISITKLADNLKNFLKPTANYVSLIKPQFEAGKDVIGKKGIISDTKTHLTVLRVVIGQMREKEYYLNNLTFSPIKGTKGNIEFLALFTFNKSEEHADPDSLIIQTMKQAHEALG